MLLFFNNNQQVEILAKVELLHHATLVGTIHKTDRYSGMGLSFNCYRYGFGDSPLFWMARLPDEHRKSGGGGEIKVIIRLKKNFSVLELPYLQCGGYEYKHLRCDNNEMRPA